MVAQIAPLNTSFSFSTNTASSQALSPLFDAARGRTLSTASTSSSLSLTSPGPSTGNSSSSSLNIPADLNATEKLGQNLIHTTSKSQDTSPEVPDFTPESPEEYVLAMHDFVPQQPNDTCLSFHAGQIIHVLNRDPSGWWDGELDGRRGWFPSNYVNKDVLLLTQEELPASRSNRRGHAQTMSQASVTSWTSTPSPQPNSSFIPKSRESFSPDSAQNDTYCPPIMVNLLNSLQLLQGTVRARRVAHYQPSVAFIISCIRSVLKSTDCLPRDALVLQQFPSLAQERKRVLADLAALVAQARKTSLVPRGEEDDLDPEEELMLRLAGQVFARVRRFLAVAVQCGIEVPQETPEDYAHTAATGSDGEEPRNTALSDDDVDMTARQGVARPDAPKKTFNGSFWRRSRPRQRDVTVTPSTLNRAKSLGDLKRRKSIAHNELAEEYADLHIVQVPQTRDSHIKPKSHGVVKVTRRGANSSISSTSSFSSSSSFDSYSPSEATPFPTGPCTSKSLLVALRNTHDNLLSTIAAFIGHVHSHSRSAHASSTGHLYDLARQIVELVCKVLIVAEAIMRHPDVPLARTGILVKAKEGLYSCTNNLADSVRTLATSVALHDSEEDEKQELLRLATGTLKAGAECVGEAKKILSRPMGGDPLLFLIPATLEAAKAVALEKRRSRGSTGTLVGNSTVKLTTLPESATEAEAEVETDALDGVILSTTSAEEDATTQNDKPLPVPGSGTTSLSNLPLHPTAEAVSRDDTVSVRSKLVPHPNLRVELTSTTESDLASPTSYAQTDEATTWEGSHQNNHNNLVHKLINGDLPSVPSTPLDETEDPLPWLQHDYSPQDVAYNTDGHLVGATMAVLVEKMTPFNATVDQTYSEIFFLTFRLFSTPTELVDILLQRYNLQPPLHFSPEEVIMWTRQKLLPLRLRIANVIKQWMENQWRPDKDSAVLPQLRTFATTMLPEVAQGLAQRLEFLIRTCETLAETSGSSRTVDRMTIRTALPTPALSDIPRPVMTKALLSALRSRNFNSISITDFDSTELARQLTILESTLYCAVTVEEVLDMGQPGAPPAVNVKALSTLSTVITGWVAEAILREHDIKKRTGLAKFFIKVADRCTSLNNFSTPRAILAALDSSTIARLRQTWVAVPQKQKLLLESLRKLADHARNYHEYRSRLRATQPPAVPFLGLYLTDLTFCREGNPSLRSSPTAPHKQLLNFNKYHKLARIAQDMQRFQVRYNLKEIPEVQEYLQFCFEKSKDHGNLDDLYRRSLLIEPRQAADATPTSDLRNMFGFGGRTSSSSQAAAA